MIDLFNHGPYTDLHRLDLDWMISVCKRAEKALTDLDSEIASTVSDKLEEWKEDGTLDEIINEEIFADLTEQVAALETALDALEVKTGSLSGRAVVMIGDSYLRGVGSGNSRGWGWYFRDKTGCTAYMYGNSGAGFVTAGHSEDWGSLNFQQLTTRAMSEHPDADLVIIAGGYNDHDADITAINTAVTNCINTVKTAAPRAQIAVVPLSAEAAFTSGKWNVYTAITRAAGREGVITTFDSIYWLYGRSAWCYGDGIHPSNEGYQVQGGYIASLVQGGNPMDVTRWTEGYSWGPSTDSVSSSFRAVQENGLVSCQGSIVTTGTLASETPLITLGPTMAPGQTLYCPVFLYNEEQTYREVGIVRIYTNGNITIQPKWAGQTDLTIYCNFSFMAGFAPVV